MFTFFGVNVLCLWQGTPKPYGILRTFDWGREIRVYFLKNQNKAILKSKNAMYRVMGLFRMDDPLLRIWQIPGRPPFPVYTNSHYTSVDMSGIERTASG
jgi:hypothetical protein